MLQIEIRIKGQIAEHWSAWFEGLTITHSDEGETILSGDVIDQAVLYGLLAKLRDLGLPLLSVNSAPKEPQEAKKHPPAWPSD
ncbi:MAG: hypothetical protein AAB217_17150 [Chloroflexota bacterium]